MLAWAFLYCGVVVVAITTAFAESWLSGVGGYVVGGLFLYFHVAVTQGRLP